MTGDELLNAMEHIDAELIEGADIPLKNRKIPYWVAATAAILAIVVVIGLLGDKSPTVPVMQGSQPNELPKLSAVQSPHTLQLMNMVAAPQYPDMPQYPEMTDHVDITSEAYKIWLAGQKDQYSQPGGYADSLALFFRESFSQFLNTEENSAFSPLNVYMALALLAETTDGNSRQQILDLLGMNTIEDLRMQVGYVWNAHYCNDGSTTLVLSNSIWLSDQFDFRQACMDTLAKDYYVSAFHGTMGSDYFNQQLQQWLDSQTGGLFSEQVKNIEMDASTMFALASTVYFSAGWGGDFSKQDTQEMTFHCISKDLITPFMCKTYTGTYYYSDNFGAVRLSLSGNNDMWLILPDEGSDIAEIIEGHEYLEMVMSPSDWEQQQNNIKITIQLPKFDITSNLNLNNGLKNLGITDVFDCKLSNFSSITDAGELILGRVDHTTRVRIDEEGCLGSAYTVAVFYPTASPYPPNTQKIIFTLNRPFLFIVSSRDNLPIFAGVVNEP